MKQPAQRSIPHNTLGPVRVWTKVSPLAWKDESGFTMVRLSYGRWLGSREDYDGVARTWRIGRTMQECSWMIDEWEEKQQAA